jgi:hypothetical protein
MKDDTSMTPAPTGAIDWASDKHLGAGVDHTGGLVGRYEFAHTAAGLAAMVRRFARHGVSSWTSQVRDADTTGPSALTGRMRRAGRVRRRSCPTRCGPDPRPRRRDARRRGR